MIRNLAQDAAYFAARQVMVPGATSAEAVQVATDVMGMMTATGFQVDVDPIDADAPNAVVTVTVDFDQIALFAPMFLPNSIITTTARIRTERYDGFFEQ